MITDEPLQQGMVVVVINIPTNSVWSIYFALLKLVQMSMVQNFEIISDNIEVVQSYPSGSYLQE